MTPEYELVVRGGTVVTADGRGDADIGVRDGRVAQIGGPMAGTRELDARGAFVVPGALDMHVHFSTVSPEPGEEPLRFVDDFATGSRAAVAGGVTTFGQMSFPEDDLPVATIREAMTRDAAAAAAQSVTDYVLHPGVFTATTDLLEAIPELAAAGHMSLKVVTLAFDHDPANLINAIKLAGDHGMLTIVHCEDDAIIEFLTGDLIAHGHGHVSHYPDSRPEYTETAAVERAIAICEATGAPLCLAHLSAASAVASARRARARGLPVFVETRPVYLHRTAAVYQDADPGRFVGMPPQRSAGDVDALWRGLADGSIHTVASDHAPWYLADKTDPGLDVRTCRKGIAEIETMVPMLFDAGVRAGRISLERLVAVTATNAARLNGLYPRKGTIAVGSDADLVVLDPDLRRTIDARTMQSRADYCIYDGAEVTGWPRFTVSRGEVVVDHGQVVAPAGRGRLVPRTPTAAP